MPIVANVTEFGTTCLAWWRAMQPSWRGEELKREIPGNADWSPVLCGGPNGMLLVVLVLAWWIGSCDIGSLADERLMEMVAEVSWTLGEMCGHLAGKRRNDGQVSGG